MHVISGERENGGGGKVSGRNFAGARGGISERWGVNFVRALGLTWWIAEKMLGLFVGARRWVTGVEVQMVGEGKEEH